MAAASLQVSFSVPALEATRSRQSYLEALEGRADPLYAEPARDAASALLHECLIADFVVAYRGQEPFASSMGRWDVFPVVGTVLLMTAATARAAVEGYSFVGLGDDQMPLEVRLIGGDLEMQWRPNPDRLRLPVAAASEGLWDACRRVRELVAQGVPEALRDRYLGAWLRSEEPFPRGFVTAGP